METVKTNRYMILYSTTNPKKCFQIDRYANLEPGDKVAVQHSNRARVETLTNKNKNSYILGKVALVINSLVKDFQND